MLHVVARTARVGAVMAFVVVLACEPASGQGPRGRTPSADAGPLADVTVLDARDEARDAAETRDARGDHDDAGLGADDARSMADASLSLDAGAQCLIDGVEVPEGAADPVGLGCRTCEAGRSMTAWTPCPAPTWRQAWPPGRTFHTLTALDDGALLVGGLGVYAHVEVEAFRYDGRRWLDESARLGGVGARQKHAAVFDPVRRRTILFGGSGLRDARLHPNETWERDASGHWTLARVVGGAPEAREGAAMAFDTARGRAVLFGGSNGAGSYFQDTWEYDGQRWALVSTSGPPAREGHAMTFDPTRGAVVLSGGLASGTTHGDAWAWDGRAWTSLGSAPRRHHHGMTFDGRLGRVLLVGGLEGELTAHVEAFVLETTNLWTQIADVPATMAGASALAYVAARGESVVTGSHPGMFSAGTYRLTAQGWEPFGDGMPELRSAHAMASDTGRDEVVLFGGNHLPPGGSPVVYGDTWLFNGYTWRAARVSGPPARYDHAMAYDPRRREVVLYGGTTANGATSDETWLWNGTSWRQVARTTPWPEPRVRSAMAFDPTLGGVVLAGGQDRPTTWLFDGNGWRQVGSGPTAQFAEHTMAYDAVGMRLVTCGGTSQGVWQWRSSSAGWNRAADIPFEICLSRDVLMTFDARRDVLVTYDSLLGSTMYGAGATWADPGWAPRWRLRGAMASTSRGAVMFGGVTQVQQTWVFGHD